jgi:hypothetical protein
MELLVLTPTTRERKCILANNPIREESSMTFFWPCRCDEVRSGSLFGRAACQTAYSTKDCAQIPRQTTIDGRVHPARAHVIDDNLVA